MKNADFGFARLCIERPLRRVWRIDQEVLLRAPKAMADKLRPLGDVIFKDSDSAQKALASANLEGRELKSCMKLIATTDEKADPLFSKNGGFEPDPDLRENENIPLPEGYIGMSQEDKNMSLIVSAQTHLKENIHPYLKDTWIDHAKTKIGYEIPFTRQFYVYTPPRPVEEIHSEIQELEFEIKNLMKELF